MQRVSEGKGGQACRGVKQAAAMICLLILKKALANKSFFFKCVEEHDNFHKFLAYSQKMRNEK